MSTSRHASKNKPEVALTVNGYDCTGDGEITVTDCLALSQFFRDAAAHIANKNSEGELACRVGKDEIANIVIDRGGLKWPERPREKMELPVLGVVTVTSHKGGAA